MKRILLTALVSSAAIVALAQYSIGWHKVSGGGGAGSNGQYSVSGTIGQHDLGAPTSGGNYSVAGGFWSLYAVQTLGTPTLSITLTTSNTAVISWASPSSGYGLQRNTSLNTTNWLTASESVNDDGVTRFIVVSPSSGNSFYRLQHP